MKIKLKSYEKKWCALIAGFIVYCFILNMFFPDGPEWLRVGVSLIFGIWLIISAMGVLYVGAMALLSWWDNVGESSWFLRLKTWFETDDRE